MITVEYHQNKEVFIYYLRVFDRLVKIALCLIPLVALVITIPREPETIMLLNPLFFLPILTVALIASMILLFVYDVAKESACGLFKYIFIEEKES
jgi:hypothetical protein